MDGLAAMRLIRERAALSHIPVVFLSGHAIPEWQREAREAGCSDYLVKPLDMGQLDRVLSRHLLLRAITGPAAQSRLSTRGIL
jgi:CheY-like chemotaxis protein